MFTIYIFLASYQTMSPLNAGPEMSVCDITVIIISIIKLQLTSEMVIT